MACGDKYKDLLSVRGYPPDKPCGWGGDFLCTDLDAAAWEVRADEIFSLVNSAWNSLMNLENGLQNWTETEALYAQTDTYYRSHAAIPRWTLWERVSRLAAVQQIMWSCYADAKLGLCVLERLNDALKRRQSGSVEPGGSPKPSGWFPGGLLPEGPSVVLLVGAAFLVFLFMSPAGGRLRERARGYLT